MLHFPRARPLFGAVLAALALMAVSAAGAEAKLVKLTGSSTVTPSEGAKQFLANAGVSVATTGPASFENGSYSFPIVAGFGDTETYNGLLAHSGGLMFTKGERSVELRRFVAVRVGDTAKLLAQVKGRPGNCGQVARALHKFAKKHPRIRRGVRRLAHRYPRAAHHLIRATRRYCHEGRVIVLADLTNLAKSVEDGTATLTADLRLSRQAANIVNRLAKAEVVSAGALLGSATSTVTPVE